jgi:hypothetical protein
MCLSDWRDDREAELAEQDQEEATSRASEAGILGFSEEEWERSTREGEREMDDKTVYGDLE